MPKCVCVCGTVTRTSNVKQETKQITFRKELLHFMELKIGL